MRQSGWPPPIGLVDAGCCDCLVTAYREYDALRTDPAVARIAEVGTIRAAALVALREREHGTPGLVRSGH
jgi:hypothetical protein